MISLIYIAALAVAFAPISQSRTPTYAGGLVHQACNDTPNHDLCVSLLVTDPRSKKADVPELALILIDKLKAKATEASYDMKRLLRNSEPKLKAPLQECVDRYNAVLVGDIPEAIEALQKGDPKFAENGANDAAIEADACEKSFHGKSPLTDKNKATRDVAAIAAAVVRQLL